MKKLNNKGVTLVELIVSFAIVGVAIIYFFQTLYTVKVIYSDARKETQKFVDKDYALRIADAYIEEKGNTSIESVCTIFKVCDSISISTDSLPDKIVKYDLIGSYGTTSLYRYEEH